MAGVLINLLLCASAALATEALLLTWRGQAIRPALEDGSALVSAVLLAVALPSQAPGGCRCRNQRCHRLGKQAFGGVGRNLFNPAMVGYAFALLSFPLQMNHWPGQRLACSTACT
jgi:electron transport complex protein RnfD